MKLQILYIQHDLCKGVFFFTLKCDFVQFNILNSGEMTINTMSINIDSLENKMKMLGVENRTNCPALENV